MLPNAETVHNLARCELIITKQCEPNAITTEAFAVAVVMWFIALCAFRSFRRRLLLDLRVPKYRRL